MIQSCENCISTHSWNGCGIFDSDGSDCSWWRDMFGKGSIVEVRNDDFRFSFKGELINEYARGRITIVDNEDIKVHLFCNGKDYTVKRNWLYLMG